QQFISFLDTGSSDTWVVTSDLECVEISTQVPLDQSACGFGPLYNLTQGQWTNITGLAFEIEYFPELEILDGDMAYAPITMGGITVEQQEVALVDYSAWSGDGHSSGLVGLAYPAITSAINRTTGQDVEYNPLFSNMVAQGLVSDAVFTIALDQVPQNYSVLAPAGAIAIGGLVPEEYWEGNFTTVDIEVTQNIGAVTELTWYTTTHEFVFRDARNGTLRSGGTFQSIVDCGTAPNFVPTLAAYEVNAQFDPPATYNSTLGYWTVDCNATAPYAAYVIGGVEMPMRPENMIVRSLNGLEGYEDVCFSAFADGGIPAIDGPMIIGEVWQLGYVIAYDQGNSQIHFAQRSDYS
ncbi:aspartic peptidase domain-containing protein, partial [Coniella lustricola]